MALVRVWAMFQLYWSLRQREVRFSINWSNSSNIQYGKGGRENGGGSRVFSSFNLASTGMIFSSAGSVSGNARRPQRQLP